MTDESQAAPGDLPEPDDYPWGGDGGDLSEPVRAHVLAALVPTAEPYPPPLDQLLSLGEPGKSDTFTAIVALGLGQEHVPDLVRMARDRALHTAPAENPAVWAPIHALTAMETLAIADVVDELTPLFDLEDDYLPTEIEDLLCIVGEPALAPLERYLLDGTRWIYGRSNVATAVSAVAENAPELRKRALAILQAALERADENDPTINGFILSALLDLDAVEALPAIRAAFEANRIDLDIVGDWGETLEALGEEADPNDPLLQRRRPRLAPPPMAALGTPGAAPARARAPSRSSKGSSHKKHKNKRKMSAASRKANKKKKK